VAVIPVLVQPNHPMLSGCKFFSVTDSSSSINCLLPVGGTAGTVSGGATLGTLGLPPWNAIQGDATDNLVTWGNFSSYFGSTDRDITVICRVKAKSSHIGGAAGCRVASPVNGWQMLFSNFSGSETGWNFAIWAASGKFQEAQDGIGAATQVNKDVVVAGTYANATKVIELYTRQPTDAAALFRNNRTNTNSGSPGTEDWDIRCSTPMYWLATRSGADYGNIDVAWLAVFNRVLSASEIAAFSQDESWPFIRSTSPAIPFFGGPQGFQHPTRWQLDRPEFPKLYTAPPPPPAGQIGQMYAPPLTFSPAKGPWNIRPPVPLQTASAATVLAPPPPKQLYAPEFKGGPLKGPWAKRPTPGSSNPALPVPPPPPPIIVPQAYAPPFHGGPMAGPWRVGPFIPPAPVPTPPLVPPPPPAAPVALPLFDIDAGKDVGPRLRRHTQKLAAVLNSLIRQGILSQTGDVDWTLDVTGLGTTGPTGTFNSGHYP
jgi:hypothetical protein